MKVRFIGGESGGDGSPRLYASDRDTLVVQGWKTSSADQIEIPHRLLAFAEPGTCLHGLRDTGHGTFLLDGDPLTDPEALEIMQIPDHEAAVEISIGVEVRPDAVATGG
ncbi:hypothetical protein FOH10_21115 [Nocardia otitidiscaviarum]|uniref:Uncharacterized protein n=1 Tax=Nocardia otitidiscaviarum TaxID=1823 RepID=A0A516NPK0_9NOCA|nr:hypothetical protein [Nocardia otitidiscaviarum]MCP9623872.1 hypothetical protein [Nocardia otitidiscaviarum]QDP80837.1 hypothetical protein FOH10_21115 [Nocardia otitidiscaviarum]